MHPKFNRTVYKFPTKSILPINPTGAGAEEFTKRLGETAERERQVALKQKQQFQIEGLPARSGLKARNPDLYNSIINEKGLTPDVIDSFHKSRQAPGGQETAPAFTPDVLNYAKTHNITPEQANAVKMQRTQAPAPSQTPTPDGMAYGGMVGGLPSSNFAAAQAMRPPKPPHLNLHSPRGYADGGEVKGKPDNSTWIKNSNQSYAGNDPKQDAKVYTGYTQGGAIPGRAQVHGDSPKNDTVPIMASPGEYVVPRHVMQGPAGRLIRKLCEGGTV